MAKVQTYEEAVLKIVMWWSEKSFKTPMNQNNGDDSTTEGIVHMMINAISRNIQKDISEDQIKIFEKELTSLLLKKENSPIHEKYLNVDYGPCEILAKACDTAQIDPLILPCKSSTHIDTFNKATASYQYSGKIIEL